MTKHTAEGGTWTTSRQLCRSRQRQKKGQRSLQRNNTVHEVQQEEPYFEEHQDRNCDVINVRYLNFDNLKSVILTTLEFTTSQKGAQIMYKIDTGSKDNLMPLKVFKIFFPKSTIQSYIQKKQFNCIKAYNQSDIQQLGRCTVKLRNKDNSIKCDSL